MADLDALQKTLGVTFNDLPLLEQALIHSSYSNENPDLAPIPNERLEFLGDAILGFIIAEELYKRFPDFSEGEMTKLRSALARQDALARMAKAIKLGSYLHLGKGEDLSGGRQKPSLLANAYEAVLAAVYLDGGLDATLRMVETHFSRLFSEDEDPPQALDKDFKTQLQEAVQSREKTVPQYQLEAEEGPDHNKRFHVSVWLRDQLLALGSGPTKKSAQQQAASRALRLLQGESEDTQS